MKGKAKPKRVKSHALKWGRELRRFRSSSGRTQAQVAARLHLSGTMVSGFEAGYNWPSREQAATMDSFVNANGTLLELWVKLSNRELYPTFLADLVKAEPLAVTIKEFQPLVVSGLLQTKAYARSLARANSRYAPPAQIEEIVEGRMRRQEIWERPNPPKMLSILNEAVLMAPTGGVSVMVEQLSKLIEMVESHRLVLQVVPLRTSFHPGHTGMFVLMTFHDQPDCLYMEDAMSGGMHHGAELEEAREMLGELQGVAWSPEISLERLRTIWKGFRDGTSEELA